MSIEVKIPAVGESISSGVIAEWHKKSGEAVKSGDLLLTLETDKISTEITAEAEGVLAIEAEEGEEVQIGAVVATIDENGAPTATLSGSPEREASGLAPETAEESPEGDEGSDGEDRHVPVSPVVRKLAEENGVDLDQVEGTGKMGAITKRDVETIIESGAQTDSTQEPKRESETRLTVVPAESKPAEKAPPPPPPDPDGRFTRKKMSPLRRKIATHLVNAQHTAAILTTFNECDMSQVMGLRKQLQESFVAKHGVKLGFMSFFIKAVVEALKEVPGVNARIDGDDMILNHYFDIGVAVGTEKGLIVPVIRDCDQKSFAEIEQAIIDYAQRAREGKIQYEDLQGGVFTISNGGIYGSMLSTPILNPPQSGILGMHNIQKRPVVVDDEIVIRPMMYLALSYDHRIVDGKEAVTFLIRVKECIEQPARLLVRA